MTAVKWNRSPLGKVYRMHVIWLAVSTGVTIDVTFETSQWRLDDNDVLHTMPVSESEIHIHIMPDWSPVFLEAMIVDLTTTDGRVIRDMLPAVAENLGALLAEQRGNALDERFKP